MPQIAVDLDEVEAEYTAAVREFLVDVATVLINEIKRETPTGATGDLQRSFQIFQTEDDRIVLGSRIGYADDVQYGTDPHFADFDQIQVWARRKLGDESAAGAVWRHIAEEGTEPNRYVDRAFENTLDQFR